MRTGTCEQEFESSFFSRGHVCVCLCLCVCDWVGVCQEKGLPSPGGQLLLSSLTAQPAKSERKRESDGRLNRLFSKMLLHMDMCACVCAATLCMQMCLVNIT